MDFANQADQPVQPAVPWLRLRAPSRRFRSGSARRNATVRDRRWRAAWTNSASPACAALPSSPSARVEREEVVDAGSRHRNQQGSPRAGRPRPGSPDGGPASPCRRPRRAAARTAGCACRSPAPARCAAGRNRLRRAPAIRPKRVRRSRRVRHSGAYLRIIFGSDEQQRECLPPALRRGSTSCAWCRSGHRKGGFGAGKNIPGWCALRQYVRPIRRASAAHQAQPS